MKYIAGLDLGQQNDRTALVVLEQDLPREDVFGEPEREHSLYRARHIERYETEVSYTEQVARVRRTMKQLPRRTPLVVDATGVGRAVADLFADCGSRVIRVTITGGDSVTRKGSEFRVPKADLASTTQALLQTDRLQFSKRVPLTEILTGELQDFRVKVSDGGHVRFEHREGQHDDLVLALALAAWYAEDGSPYVFTGSTVTL
jgi:hypothetical protein